MKKSLQQQRLEKQAHCTSKWPYKGKVISVRSDQLQYETGATDQRDIVIHPGAVAILPINEKGNLLLIEQWRRPVDQIILELPAGILEKGEDPASCAQRELQEEIGYRANQLTSMGGIFTTPGFCNEYIHLFLATELIESALPPDEDEAIDLVEISLKEALQLIENYRIQDAKTICGILTYAMRLKT